MKQVKKLNGETTEDYIRSYERLLETARYHFEYGWPQRENPLVRNSLRQNIRAQRHQKERIKIARNEL